MTTSAQKPMPDMYERLNILQQYRHVAVVGAQQRSRQVVKSSSHQVGTHLVRPARSELLQEWEVGGQRDRPPT